MLPLSSPPPVEIRVDLDRGVIFAPHGWTLQQIFDEFSRWQGNDYAARKHVRPFKTWAYDQAVDTEHPLTPDERKAIEVYEYLQGRGHTLRPEILVARQQQGPTRLFVHYLAATAPGPRLRGFVRCHAYAELWQGWEIHT